MSNSASAMGSHSHKCVSSVCRSMTLKIQIGPRAVPWWWVITRIHTILKGVYPPLLHRIKIFIHSPPSLLKTDGLQNKATTKISSTTCAFLTTRVYLSIIYWTYQYLPLGTYGVSRITHIASHVCLQIGTIVWERYVYLWVSITPRDHNIRLLYGTHIPGKTPIYILFYVENSIYFSLYNAVRRWFETTLKYHVCFEFIGTI